MSKVNTRHHDMILLSHSNPLKTHKVRTPVTSNCTAVPRLRKPAGLSCTCCMAVTEFLVDCADRILDMIR